MKLKELFECLTFILAPHVCIVTCDNPESTRNNTNSSAWVNAAAEISRHCVESSVRQIISSVSADSIVIVFHQLKTQGRSEKKLWNNTPTISNHVWWSNYIAFQSSWIDEITVYMHVNVILCEFRSLYYASLQVFGLSTSNDFSEMSATEWD